MSARRKHRARGHSAGSKSMNNALTKTERLAFRDVTDIQRSSSAGYEISEIDLTIGSFSATSRVRALAQFYEYWRFKKLNIRAFCDLTGVLEYEATPGGIACGVAHGVGFIPSAGADFKTAVSFNDLMQYPNAEMAAGAQALRLSMGPSALFQSTPTKWYHTTNQGSPPAADLSAGVITYMTRFGAAPGGGVSYSYIVLEGELEFKASLIGTASMSVAPPNRLPIGEPERSVDYPSETLRRSRTQTPDASARFDVEKKGAPREIARDEVYALKKRPTYGSLPDVV